jgi:hypothetical protein
VKLRLSGTTLQVYRDRFVPENIHAEIDATIGDEIQIELTTAGDEVIARVYLVITERGLRLVDGES